MRTPAEEITKRLLQGFDPDYFASLYRQMCYTFGDDWGKSQRVATLNGRLFPDWPEIIVRYMEVGRSRRILNSQFIGLSRSMGNEPAPEFPQLDKFTAEVRKQWYMTRYAGRNYEGEWAAEHENAFMDGDGLGLGFLAWGLMSNPKTQYQHVTCEYSPAVLTIFDRHARTPGRADWIAFCKYLPYHKAELLLGKKVAQEYVRNLYDTSASSGAAYPLEVVRIFDYYDLGMGKGSPTRAIIPGDLGNAPVDISDNVFECIPLSYMEYFTAPGMRRATGRIVMQMATQEGLNEIERFLRSCLKNPGFSIADVRQLDRRDIARLNAGETNVIVRLTNPIPGVEPFIRVQGAEVANTILQLWTMLERQFNADSGTNDLDRGNQLEQTKTLGEAELLASRSDTQSAWSGVQATRLHRRSVEMATKIGMKFDRDPVLLDVFGDNILFNDPAKPNTWMENWLSEPSKVLIGADQLKVKDNQMDMALKRRLVEGLSPLVQMGLISPQKFAEEMLRASGFTDAGEWAPSASPATEVDPANAGLPQMVNAV